MKPNATIRPGTRSYIQSSGLAVIFSKPIRVYARIIPEDIEVTEFLYNGQWYTIDTSHVIFDK